MESPAYISVMLKGSLSGFSNDLHVFDPRTLVWSDPVATVRGTPPSPRREQGLTPVGTRLYVHGGVSDQGAA